MGEFWQSRPFQRARATNSSDASFPSRLPTITEPVNDGVINVVTSGILVPKWLMILPIGLGSPNDAYSVRVLGWRHIGGNADIPDNRLWIPAIMAEYSCTIGAMTGVAGSPVLDTELFVDTIAPVALRQADDTIAAGTVLQTQYEVSSPANDTVAYAVFPTNGWEKIEFIFDQTTNTPTMNVLYAFIS